MRDYIIRRLLIVLPTVFLVSIIIFLIVRLIPGDVVDQMAFQMGPGLVDRAALEKALGLDVPIFVQYGRWLGLIRGIDGTYNGIFQGDLGMSLWSERPVMELIALRWPVTLQLGIMALAIGQLIALPIGIFSAIRQDYWGDYIARSFAIFLIAVPGFWLATMVIVFGSILLGYSPPYVLRTFFTDPLGNLAQFIVPASVLGMNMSGTTMRMTRTMMLEVLRQNYIRTAWAKGLRERVVITRHVLKNAFIPVVTVVGMQFPLLIGGTVITEQIFNLPGMGRLLIESVTARDYSIVSGVMLFLALGVVFINLLVDITYAFLDPRIHYK